MKPKISAAEVALSLDQKGEVSELEGRLRPRRGRGDLALGDHQTPDDLARKMVAIVARFLPVPGSIVEPTCGRGGLLVPAMEAFPSAIALGVELQAEHLKAARDVLSNERVSLVEADALSMDWASLLADLVEPILVLSNPPWVTRSALRASSSQHVAIKTNGGKSRGLSGLASLTGKSNFDTSEWLIVRLIEALEGRRGALAVLCKTSVARRVLAHAWRSGIAISKAKMMPVDARRAFGVATSGALLIAEIGAVRETRCDVIEDPFAVTNAPKTLVKEVGSSLPVREVKAVMGWRDGAIVPDVDAHDRVVTKLGKSALRWRSGIKHDCAAVMELTTRDGALWNGLGARVEIEDGLLYPLRKCTEIANDTRVGRMLIVPQRSMSESLGDLAERAPRAWAYLDSYGARLDARASRIYKNRPRFSLFGVGDYSFSAWKVAVSGLHKQVKFRVIGPDGGKPVVLDDTCYFLPCASEDEARRRVEILASDDARACLRSLVFPDAKRPITTAVLDQLGKLLVGEFA